VEAIDERRTVVAREGPVTPNGAPPNKLATDPPTIALTRPTSGLTPEASAIASERGIATHPTVSPARRSLAMFSRENINFHSGMRVVRPVLFFTLSHTEGEGERERASLDGSSKDTSELSIEASDLVDSKRLITVIGLRIHEGEMAAEGTCSNNLDLLFNLEETESILLDANNKLATILITIVVQKK
jgi:hypothetical protein